VSDLRELLLGAGETGEAPRSVDVDALLALVDGMGRILAEVRAVLVAHQTPSVGVDGACLHPSADRREAGTFSQSVPFCGKCGDFL
jgi:hypothetical protein